MKGGALDIKSRKVESTQFWWECPRCGYHTHTYGSTSGPTYYKEQHEPVCVRAAEIGLAPVFDNGGIYSYNTRIRWWKRVSDGATIEIHCHRPRHEWVPCESWEEAEAAGYWAQDWEKYPDKCTRKREWHVDEVCFVIDGDWHNPVEVYDMPCGWNWREPDAEIPWLKED